FMLFGEDYLKFKHFLQPNMMVGAKINVSERVFKDKEGKVTGRRIFVNISRMQLLSEILEGVAKKVIVTVDVNDLTQEIYDSLVQVFEAHKGDKNVLFVMNDMKNKVQIKAPASYAKVEISKELMTDLRAIPNLK